MRSYLELPAPTGDAVRANQTPFPRFATNAGLDIFSDLSNGKTVSNSAFATIVTPGGDATLNTVDLLTGAATPVGNPFPLTITDIAVSLGTP